MKITGQSCDVFLADLAAAGEYVGDRRSGDAGGSPDFGPGDFFGFDQMLQHLGGRWLSLRDGLDFVAFDQRGKFGDQFAFGSRQRRSVLANQFFDVLEGTAVFPVGRGLYFNSDDFQGVPSSGKWIDDSHRVIFLTSAKVFRVERFDAGFDAGGDQQAVPV